MPIKRRNAKRRTDAEREFEIWAAIFASGRDFFREAAEIGLLVDSYGKPDREAAQDAWQRLGARFMVEASRTEPSWAEREFGAPDQ